MLVSERGAQPSGATKPVQAGYYNMVRGGIVAIAAGWLAGCSTLSSVNPANWWHRQEGGKIADDRPAPPGADAPYPNMASVPAKPAMPDAEALKKLTDSLIADRTNAQHAAQSVPLADPSSPSASPALFGVGTAPPPPPVSAAAAPAPGATGTSVASASMPAANAPAAAPAPAPRKAVQSAPLDAPAPAAPPPVAAAAPSQPAAPAAPAIPAAPLAPSAVAATPAATPPQPALPAEPPPRPGIAGPPVATPIVISPVPATVATGPSATIVFVDGATTLAPPAAGEVKAFAATRGNGVIVVTGYGDAVSSDPAAQTAALSIGLARANAVADALKADGVPAANVRVNAEASGRGASLRLLQ